MWLLPSAPFMGALPALRGAAGWHLRASEASFVLGHSSIDFLSLATDSERSQK